VQFKKNYPKRLDIFHDFAEVFDGEKTFLHFTFLHFREIQLFARYCRIYFRDSQKLFEKIAKLRKFLKIKCSTHNSLHVPWGISFLLDVSFLFEILFCILDQIRLYVILPQIVVPFHSLPVFNLVRVFD